MPLGAIPILATLAALIWLAGVTRFMWRVPWALLDGIERTLTAAAILLWPVARPLARFLDTPDSRPATRDPTDKAGA